MDTLTNQPTSMLTRLRRHILPGVVLLGVVALLGGLALGQAAALQRIHTVDAALST